MAARLHNLALAQFRSIWINPARVNYVEAVPLNQWQTKPHHPHRIKISVGNDPDMILQDTFETRCVADRHIAWLARQWSD